MALLGVRMACVVKQQEDPRVLGSGHIFDEYPTADVAVRGFYERHQ